MKKDTGAKVGIDVGSCAIKIIQTSGAAEKPELIAFGSMAVAGISGPEVSVALKSLAENSHISSQAAAISISGPSVIVRFISLPKMDDTALKGAIRYEAEKFIPYNISDCTIDFQTLRKDDKDNKLNVLLVAAKKDFVKEKIKVVEEAGFSVRVVDVDSFALANAFLASRRVIEPEKSYAILNVGGTYTNLSILKGSSIYFARDIAVGGGDFTSAISRKFGIDQKAAEDLKLQPTQDKVGDIAECIRASLNDLLDEIKLSFGYYENQAGKGIDEIYISGGSSGLVGLEQVFEEALGSKPAIWNPIEAFNTSSMGLESGVIDKMKSSFAVAAGLGLR